MATAAPLLAQPPAGGVFSDVAAETGLEFVHFAGVSGELYFVENVGSGAALFDYDGDGDLDAYLVQGNMLGPGKTGADSIFPPPGPLPLSDRLFRNDLTLSESGERRVRFVDVTEAAGIEATAYGMGTAAGDWDNDGDLDLYVTNFGANQAWRNNGDGTFIEVAREIGIDENRWSVAASFVDFDLDGWLDLYVANYVRFEFALHSPCYDGAGALEYCGPLAYEPETDRLFRNRGDGTFADVSAKSGIQAEFGGALGVIAADFDGDEWPDLYVANDLMSNQLWLNQRDGTFVNEALLAGCGVNAEGAPEASMGVDAADVDGDGDEDLIVAHLTGESNTLYLNDGRGMFRDRSLDLGLATASWVLTTFSAAWLDFDSDGWLDLLTTNGTVRTIEELVARGDPYPLHQRNQLFHNSGRGRFVDVSREAGEPFRRSRVSRGAALGDVDRDGDVDVLLSNNSGPAELLVNQVGGASPWLAVRAIAGPGARDLYGARAWADRAGRPSLWRRIRSDGSYASVNEPRAVFGLDGAPRVSSLAIARPGGGRWRLEDPPVACDLIVPVSRREGDP